MLILQKITNCQPFSGMESPLAERSVDGRGVLRRESPLPVRIKIRRKSCIENYTSAPFILRQIGAVSLCLLYLNSVFGFLEGIINNIYESLLY